MTPELEKMLSDCAEKGSLVLSDGKAATEQQVIDFVVLTHDFLIPILRAALAAAEKRAEEAEADSNATAETCKAWARRFNALELAVGVQQMRRFMNLGMTLLHNEEQELAALAASDAAKPQPASK